MKRMPSVAQTTHTGTTHYCWASDPAHLWGRTACGRAIDLTRSTDSDPADASLRWCRPCRKALHP